MINYTELIILSTDQYMQRAACNISCAKHCGKSHIHDVFSLISFFYFFSGYLVSSLFLSEDHELIVLLVNTLQKVCVILNLTCSMLCFVSGLNTSISLKKKLKAKGCMLEKTSKK